MLIISSEKVENVVKPPQKPILKNKLNLKSIAKEFIIPMSKHPIKLISSVEIGNFMLAKIRI